MVKRLKLKPSARDKRRYFLVGASNARVEAAILKYIGVLGFGKSAYRQVDGGGLKVDGKTIGSCLVKSLEDVRAALALDEIRIEKVSGTLKSLGLKGGSRFSKARGAHN